MRRLLSSFREHHNAWVAAWLSSVSTGSRPADWLALFDQAFAALWRRAHPTLGQITLSAAFDRTLREVAEKFPVLSSLRVEAAGMSFDELRGDERTPGADLAEALRFLLVEMLTALGSLTGEALTPLLHRELAHSGTVVEGGPGRSGAGPRLPT